MDIQRTIAIRLLWRVTNVTIGRFFTCNDQPGILTAARLPSGTNRSSPIAALSQVPPPHRSRAFGRVCVCRPESSHHLAAWSVPLRRSFVAVADSRRARWTTQLEKTLPNGPGFWAQGSASVFIKHLGAGSHIASRKTGPLIAGETS